MSIETFTTNCSRDDVLSPDEKIGIFQFIAVGTNGEQIEFSDKRRAVFRKRNITRLPENDRSCWGYGGKADAIDFIVSETAMIRGIGLFSPFKSGTVKGVVSLLRDDKSVLTDKEVEMTYSPSKCQEEVLFDEGVSLKPGVKYTIKVLLKGCQTTRGSNGRKVVTAGDFRITFSDNNVSTNGTGVQLGQIPFLIIAIRQK